jgi:amino acid permease
MAKKEVLAAISTLIGTVIGAGIFAIPYVVAKAGFITGLIDIILIGAAVLLMNLYIGEITLRTKGFHQLTGYAERYLGKIGKKLMAFAMIFGIYGALIAYMMGEGQALHAIFKISSPLFFSFLFYVIVIIIVYLGLKAIADSEMFMVPIIILLTLVIIFFAFNKLDFTNLTSFNITKIFLPYGVILFAFLGSSAIPEMREELVKNEKQMKKCILIGMLIPMFIYLLFAFVVVGVTGLSTTEVATIGLGNKIGEIMILFGNIFVVFAMATSFIALALALEQMFNYDYKLSKNISWLLTVIIPLIIFLTIRNIAGFSTVINITGAISGGLTGILVVLMAWSAIKKGNRKPEFSISKSKLIGLILIVVFIIGMLYEILNTLGIIRL